MSVNYGADQRFIRLRKQLEKSWLKKDNTQNNSASVALTKHGEYYSGMLESRTHLLDITSEHGALAIAVSAKDAEVYQIMTVVKRKSNETFCVNPLVVKILVDHVRRTGISLSYRVLDIDGEEIYYCKDVYQLGSQIGYSPLISRLKKIKPWVVRRHKQVQEGSLEKEIEEQLWKCAILGTKTHFSAGTKTCYGSAVLANSIIYYGGVYSSFDHRLNLHSEMVASLSAIADGNREITHVAVVSNKFVEEPVSCCGCCRQFLSEIQEKTKVDITLLCFSYDGEKVLRVKLSDHLPSAWHSGLPLEEREKNWS